MGMADLLRRVSGTHEPLFRGEWAALAFRPDLGSQQEFIIGVAILIEGDGRPSVRWLPSFSKLSSLYGDAISSSEVADLTSGSEASISRGEAKSLALIDTGTPHIRVIRCGYIATNNVDEELSQLLRKHAGGLWAEHTPRESPMDDDWAYAEMRRALSSIRSNVFVPNRMRVWNSKELYVGLDNGRSFGNIVSARYASVHTIERHINASLRHVMVAHHMTNRVDPPALFVVLSESNDSTGLLIRNKTGKLLQEIEDMGVAQYSDVKPEQLATSLREWAGT